MPIFVVRLSYDSPTTIVRPIFWSYDSLKICGELPDAYKIKDSERSRFSLFWSTVAYILDKPRITLDYICVKAVIFSFFVGIFIMKSLLEVIPYVINDDPQLARNILNLEHYFVCSLVVLYQRKRKREESEKEREKQEEIPPQRRREDSGCGLICNVEKFMGSMIL